MNIKQAKEEIIRAVLAYHRKDERGCYQYPLIRQRPILLIGPPGIGKTAIMEQAAEACQVGLVAYTITHHTRQSAIGLPHIVSRKYQGREYSVTEYTLSEIIASVYECMERTGKQEGILFIDEINCVSETLAPTMLQFLQNKTFGSHKVPEGWLIVAAGNPPEYNKSVREFDIVTLDRVRKIEIQADCGVWLEYALDHGVHPAVLAYLFIKKDCFYQVENRADEKYFVTARGWEDLSELLKSYEDLGLEVNADLVVQFLQKNDIARDFAAYYQLYRKYDEDYQIPEILSGRISIEGYQEKAAMARLASFEERFTVTELILKTLDSAFLEYGQISRFLHRLREVLSSLEAAVLERKNKKSMEGQPEGREMPEYLETMIRRRRESLAVKEKMELISREEASLEAQVTETLEDYLLTLQKQHISDVEQGMERIKAWFETEAVCRKQLIAKIREMLERSFQFLADCFGEEQEMILLVSGLTRNRRAAEFIGKHGSDAYLKYCDIMLGSGEEELRQACREALEIL